MSFNLRKLFSVVAILSLPLLIVSCGQKIELGSSDTLALSIRKATVSSSAGSVFVTVEATGAWNITLQYPEGTDTDWAIVNPAQGTGNAGNVSLSFSANSSAEPRSVTLSLSTKTGRSTSTTLVQEGSSGASYGGWGTGRYGDKAARYSWLELPATSPDDGLEFFVHNMEGGRYVSQAQDGTRNYSFYWNYDEHLSFWVAYPLNPSLYAGNNFDYAWGLDPLLPRELQPNLTNNSYGGGWTRGHMLPRADRQGSQAKVASTCYPTNLTPQDWDHNGGIWVKLESQVRAYASTADTLYVVTGCVVDGSNTYTGTSSGFKVRVPSAYFKALLYYGPNGNASATGRYMAAGFYVPHSKEVANNSFYDYIMPISQLEQKTGIDFFVNLPAKVGKETAQKIESKLIDAFWK